MKHYCVILLCYFGSALRSILEPWIGISLGAKLGASGRFKLPFYGRAVSSSHGLPRTPVSCVSVLYIYYKRKILYMWGRKLVSIKSHAYFHLKHYISRYILYKQGCYLCLNSTQAFVLMLRSDPNHYELGQTRSSRLDTQNAGAKQNSHSFSWKNTNAAQCKAEFPTISSLLPRCLFTSVNLQLTNSVNGTATGNRYTHMLNNYS